MTKTRPAAHAQGMNAAGVFLIAAGVLVLTQVFGGDALGRLRITGGGDAPLQVDRELDPGWQAEKDYGDKMDEQLNGLY